MASERFRELLSGLEEATRDKKVRWSETAKETAFRIAFGKGLVRIILRRALEEIEPRT